jgi:hypothetical protein
MMRQRANFCKLISGRSESDLGWRIMIARQHGYAQNLGLMREGKDGEGVFIRARKLFSAEHAGNVVRNREEY